MPTALVFVDGHDFFVGNLDTFPIKDGSSKILKITPGKGVAMFRPEPNSGTPVRMHERKEKLGTLESPEIPALIAPHWAQF